MENGGVQAGWYPDPAGSGWLRWWDGVAWTTHLGPATAPPEPHLADAPPAGSSMRRPVATIVALGILGVFVLAAVGFGLDRLGGATSAQPNAVAARDDTISPVRRVSVPTTLAPPQPGVPASELELEDMGSTYVFPAPEDAAANARAAGLSMDAGSTEHFHVHLQILLESGGVVVPAGIGIAPDQRAAPLHTHDTSGIIHVEADAAHPFTLGQFFTEWGQPLGSNSIGHVQSRPGFSIVWFVNGQRVADPGLIVLKPHQVIVAYEDGDGSTIVPPGYAWPSGF